MKRSKWLILARVAAAAAGLRAWQAVTGFEGSGLPVRGNLPGVLLPILLTLAVLYFLFAARGLPSRKDRGELEDCFRFQNMPAVFCAVSGAFLVMAGAALAAVSHMALLLLLLSVFGVAAAVSVLATVFALYRGSETSGVALLVPVWALIVYLIVLYRAEATDPVIARVYVNILAVAALTFSALERAAFAFRDGSPRVWLPACAMAAILSLAAAAERRGLASALFFIGCALVELAFLAAAEFDEEEICA